MSFFTRGRLALPWRGFLVLAAALCNDRQLSGDWICRLPPLPTGLSCIRVSEDSLLQMGSCLLVLLSGITQNQQCFYPHNIQNTHVTFKQYVRLVAQQHTLPQDNDHKQWILFGKFLLFIPCQL